MLVGGWRRTKGKRCHARVRRGMGGGLVGVFPPSVRVRLPLEGWPELNESSGSVACQGCRWHGIAVMGTTGTPSTVTLPLYRSPLYSIPPHYLTDERERGRERVLEVGGRSEFIEDMQRAEMGEGAGETRQNS